MTERTSITGLTFGQLLVLSREPNEGHFLMYRVVCACGVVRVCRKGNLVSGNTTSCGCKGESHSLARHPLYSTWNMMMFRCYNRKADNFHNYGGRGITVCRRWHSVKNFIADMAPRPTGKQLDRVNNSKGYSPANCRWATLQEQARNKRNNFKYLHEGRRRTIPEISEMTGISIAALESRKARNQPLLGSLK